MLQVALRKYDLISAFVSATSPRYKTSMHPHTQRFKSGSRHGKLRRRGRQKSHAAELLLTFLS